MKVSKILKNKGIKPIFHAIKEKAKSEEEYNEGISEEYKMYLSLEKVEIDIDEEEFQS